MTVVIKDNYAKGQRPLREVIRICEYQQCGQTFDSTKVKVSESSIFVRRRPDKYTPRGIFERAIEAVVGTHFPPPRTWSSLCCHGRWYGRRAIDMPPLKVFRSALESRDGSMAAALEKHDREHTANECSPCHRDEEFRPC